MQLIRSEIKIFVQSVLMIKCLQKIFIYHYCIIISNEMGQFKKQACLHAEVFQPTHEHFMKLKICIGS